MITIIMLTIMLIMLVIIMMTKITTIILVHLAPGGFGVVSHIRLSLR